MDVSISDLNHLSPLRVLNGILSGVSRLRNDERITRGIVAQNLSYELLGFSVAVTRGSIDHGASAVQRMLERIAVIDAILPDAITAEP